MVNVIYGRYQTPQNKMTRKDRHEHERRAALTAELAEAVENVRDEFVKVEGHDTGSLVIVPGVCIPFSAVEAVVKRLKGPGGGREGAT